MTKLYIPSLQRLGEFNEIESLTKAEALEFVRDFTDKCIKTKKCYNTNPSEKLDMEFFNNVLPENPSAEYLEKLFKSFSYSNVPTTRGYRAIFVGDDEVGVGTTILYNLNRAALNFSNPSTMDDLLYLSNLDTCRKNGIPILDVGDITPPPAPVATVADTAPAYQSIDASAPEAAALKTEPKYDPPKKSFLQRLFGG